MYIVKVTDEKMYTCIIGKPPCLSGDESVCNTGTQVGFLGWEDLVEKEMATHSSILAWKSH